MSVPAGPGCPLAVLAGIWRIAAAAGAALPAALGGIATAASLGWADPPRVNPEPDDPLEPLSCATQRPLLPEHLARILDLRFSPGMLDPAPEGWGEGEIQTFGELLLGKADAPGPVARVWSYYGTGEALARGESPRFSLSGRDYDRLRLDLYLASDCCGNPCGRSGCPSAWPDSCRQGSWVECQGYGVYRGGNRLQFSGGECPRDTPKDPVTLARSPVLAHELSHLAHSVRDPYAERALSEMLATGAEYLVGERWNEEPPIPRAHEYDVSLKTGSPENNRCVGNEVTCKYNLFRLWNAYLFAHCSGDSDGLDAVYRWMRRAGPSGKAPTWRGLAEVLAQEPYASRIPGSTPGEKLGTIYQRYAVARYADAPDFGDGRFGFGPEVSTRILHLFEWPDSLSLARRRVIPPVLRLSPGETRRVERWRDPEQPWAGDEPCRVLTTGTDYVVILPGTTRRTPGTLRVRVRGEEPLPSDQSLRLGYIAYADPASAVIRGRPLEIRAGEPGEAGAPSRFDADPEIVVGDFGGRIGGVVLVLSMVERDPSESLSGVQAWDYSLDFAFDTDTGRR